MEQKKIDMNVVTAKYAQVFDYISKAKEILDTELIPLLPDGVNYKKNVIKVENDFLNVAEEIAKDIMVEAAIQIDKCKQP